MSTVGQLNKVIVCAMCLGLTTMAVAQNEPAPKATKIARTTPEAKEFETLFSTRAELGKKLGKLQADISKLAKPQPDSTPEMRAQNLKQQQALIEQFNGMVTEFEANTLPKLLALAGPLYLKNGQDQEAQEIVLGYLQDLYHENKYKQLIAEGNKYLEAGRKHPLILNFVGVSYFAVQEFAKAEEILKQAKAAGTGDEEAGSMFAQIGAPYLGQCRTYAAMWKKELAIREAEAAAKGEDRLPRVLFKTSRGDIELELFENEAPNTVANFISLVEKKKYDGIAFHRVIPNFMAQGGDPNTLDKDPRNDGMGGPGYHIACECYQDNARMHFQGSLSMAHAGRDSGGSQFFLTHLPTGHLNPDEKAGRGHTVFGRVVKGQDAALAIRPNDKIISATVLFKRNHPYVPKTQAE